MFFLDFVHYFFGYVRFSIYGDNPERLLNVLAFQKISVWNILSFDDRIEACMYIRDYKLLPSLKGKVRVRTKHTGAFGVFVKAKQYSKRIGFAVGILCYALTLCILSTHIWQIDISKTNYSNSAALMSALESCGVYIGADKRKINAFDLPEKIVLLSPELAWATVNIEGSLATLELSEVRRVPSRDENTPCNLIAKCDGTITGHRVTDGNIMVSTGQAVTEGDLLVSGTIEYATGYTGLKHSSGEVFAKTVHNIECFVPFSLPQICTTGTQNNKSVISFFGLSLPLYLGSEQYTYDSSAEENTLTLMGKKMPISISTAHFYEITEVKVDLERADAVELCRQRLEKIAEKELSGMEIINKEEQIVEQNDGIYINNLYICNENIAMEKILSITTINN